MNVTLSGRSGLALLLFILVLWAMTDCGGQRICRLRGGMVAHEQVNADNWRCVP